MHGSDHLASHQASLDDRKVAGKAEGTQSWDSNNHLASHRAYLARKEAVGKAKGPQLSDGETPAPKEANEAARQATQLAVVRQNEDTKALQRVRDIEAAKAGPADQVNDESNKDEEMG